VKTSTTEQADDAAWLLKATGHAPAIVFGSSSGALTALDLVLRHAEVVRGAIVHEPSVFTCLPQDFVQGPPRPPDQFIAPARNGRRCRGREYSTRGRLRQSRTTP